MTNQLPFPARSGGQVREAQLITALGSRAEITLAVITDQFDRDLAYISSALAHCVEVAIFESAPDADKDTPSRVGMYRNSAFGAYLASAATKVDLVNIEGYFLVRHLPSQIGVPIVLVAENVEYDIERQRETLHPVICSNPSLVLKHESAAWNRARVVAALTPFDVAAIRALSPETEVVLSPNGFDHVRARGPRTRHRSGCAVTFLGNYRWEPTRRGAERLINSIWPRIHALAPEATLALVGAGMSPEFEKRAKQTAGVNVVGEVHSVGPYLDKTDVFLCPIDMGSGIMMKLVEALHAGCPVVTSPQALRGLPPAAARAVITAESDDEIAASVRLLVDDSCLRDRLSAAAFSACSELPTWTQAGEVMLRLWQRIGCDGEEQT
ncbi:glycosyltransferase [Nocardia salmonicida]|uniref:glycosyltransferase n=1 Tax=Nocardia salmonicida TaxID=53431 RepID=UPI003405C121